MQSGFSRDAIDDLTISCKHSLNTLKLKGSECVCVYARMAGVCVCVGGGGSRVCMPWSMACWNQRVIFLQEVPRYSANLEKDGRSCPYSLSMTMRDLRRVGITQHVLENVPKLRLSGKTLLPCFNQGELHHPQFMQEDRKPCANSVVGLFSKTSRETLEALQVAAGERPGSPSPDRAEPSHSPSPHLCTCRLCNLSRWQLHSALSNKRRDRFPENGLMTGDWDTNHKWRLSDSKWNYSLPCEIAQ